MQAVVVGVDGDLEPGGEPAHDGAHDPTDRRDQLVEGGQREHRQDRPARAVAEGERLGRELAHEHEEGRDHQGGEPGAARQGALHQRHEECRQRDVAELVADEQRVDEVLLAVGPEQVDHLALHRAARREALSFHRLQAEEGHLGAGEEERGHRQHHDDPDRPGDGAEGLEQGGVCFGHPRARPSPKWA